MLFNIRQKIKGGNYNREQIKEKTDTQETQINIDYIERTVYFYTSKKGIFKRITKQIGEATKIHYIHGEISGATWIIPFAHKDKLRKILSRPTLIGKLE